MERSDTESMERGLPHLHKLSFLIRQGCVILCLRTEQVISMRKWHKISTRCSFCFPRMCRYSTFLLLGRVCLLSRLFLTTNLLPFSSEHKLMLVKLIRVKSRSHQSVPLPRLLSISLGAPFSCLLWSLAAYDTCPALTSCDHPVGLCSALPTRSLSHFPLPTNQATDLQGDRLPWAVVPSTFVSLTSPQSGSFPCWSPLPWLETSLLSNL